MSDDESGPRKKPFKGVSQSNCLKCGQAMVEWPADMPDDMLEDVIMVSKKALDEHDFEEQGTQVSSPF